MIIRKLFRLVLKSSNVVDNDAVKKKTLYNTSVSEAAGSQAKIPNRTGFISKSQSQYDPDKKNRRKKLNVLLKKYQYK